MRLALLCLLAFVAACQPQPRSAAYFEAHPGEAAEIILACAKGAKRSGECAAAREGDAALRAKARMELFRKGFTDGR